MDECDKQGDSCPSGLQCLKQVNGSYACSCSAGYKVIGEGEWRSCQGIMHCKRLVPNRYLCVFGARKMREDWG